jgi:hypothetical protein
MKQVLALIISGMFLVSAVPAAEVEKKCVMQKDKSGKEKEVCKKVKIHKKLDGTKVPDKKK